MLVLSRKTNERIRIGHDVDIVIVEVRGDKVRLGIQAPRSLSLHRQEVYEQIWPDGAPGPPRTAAAEDETAFPRSSETAVPRSSKTAFPRSDETEEARSTT